MGLERRRSMRLALAAVLLVLTGCHTEPTDLRQAAAAFEPDPVDLGTLVWTGTPPDDAEVVLHNTGEAAIQLERLVFVGPPAGWERVLPPGTTELPPTVPSGH